MNQREFYELSVEGFHQAIDSDLSNRLQAAFKEMVGPKDCSSQWEILSETFSDAAKIFNRRVDGLYSALSSKGTLISVSLEFSSSVPETFNCQRLSITLEQVYRHIIDDDKNRNGLPRTQDTFLSLSL